MTGLPPYVGPGDVFAAMVAPPTKGTAMQLIELTDPEYRAAKSAVGPLLSDVALSRRQPDYALGDVVAAVVTAVNDVRLGAPLGELRRNTLTGELAKRCADGNGGRYWHLMTEAGNAPSRTPEQQAVKLRVNADDWNVLT